MRKAARSVRAAFSSGGWRRVFGAGRCGGLSAGNGSAGGSEADGAEPMARWDAAATCFGRARGFCEAVLGGGLPEVSIGGCKGSAGGGAVGCGGGTGGGLYFFGCRERETAENIVYWVREGRSRGGGRRRCGAAAGGAGRVSRAKCFLQNPDAYEKTVVRPSVPAAGGGSLLR